MEITVLGKSNAWPDADGACSGHLISEGDFRLLLDCGTGVFAKLRSVCPYTEVDVVVVSHLHADHFMDVVPYSYALSYSTGETSSRPLLLGPPGTRALFEELGSVLGCGDQLQRVFDVREYDDGEAIEVGPLRARFREVPHFIPAFACELTTPAGTRFTYGSDCGYNEQLIEFARGTELLMLEATGGDTPPPQPDGAWGHMTAREAGELGRAAAAQRLLLSHFSDELDASAIEREGSVGFGAPVQLAHERDRFVV